MRKHDKKENKESENASKTPGWLEGEAENNELCNRDKNKSRIQQLQHSRNSSGRRSRVRRVRQPVRNPGQTNSGNQPRDGSIERREKRILDDGTGNRGLVNITFECTLQNIKDSIPNHILQDLVDGKFDSKQTVVISKTKRSTSMLMEDALLGPSKFSQAPKAKKKKKKITKPSEKFLKDISAFERDGIISARTILGYYFTLYKNLYGEEDPDYVNASIQSATIAVDTMIKKTIGEDGDYKKVINFVKQIMPAWHRQLKQGAKFPNSRPTVTALFGGRLYFWANRKLLIRQWRNN